MTNSESQKKKRTWKREILEWVIILSVGFFIYAMGWHTEIIGRLQQAVLWTGVIQPETELVGADQEIIDYDMPLIRLDGERAHLSTYKGDVIFLNFWATWCAPCIAEMPNIQALYDQYKDDPALKFVMVSLDEDPKKAQDFLKNRGFTFEGYRLGGNRPEVFQSSIIPTTYIVSKDGRLVSKKRGMANYNTSAFKKFLNELLGE